MKDNRIGCQKLLVARSNKGGGKICGGRYVEECDACQRCKNRSETPAGKPMPNTILEKPWSHISVDFITKLPLA